MLRGPLVEGAAGGQVITARRARGGALGQVTERLDDALHRHVAEAEAAYPWRVDKPAGVPGQRERDRGRRGVPALAGDRVDPADRAASIRHQAVDQGRFPDARLADEDAQPTVERLA